MKVSHIRRVLIFRQGGVGRQFGAEQGKKHEGWETHHREGFLSEWR